jgi:hypothetical protein
VAKIAVDLTAEVDTDDLQLDDILALGAAISETVGTSHKKSTELEEFISYLIHCISRSY